MLTLLKPVNWHMIQKLYWHSTDRTVRLWNATTGVVISEMSGHSAYVNTVDFSPDGKILECEFRAQDS